MQIIEEASLPERPRVLVIDGLLMTAEAIVMALGPLAFAGHLVIPVTGDHLREAVSWCPEMALLDIDSVAGATCLECVDILHGADIPFVVMGGDLDRPLLGKCIYAGASAVVDKSSPLSDLFGVIGRQLAGEVLLREDLRQRLIESYDRETQARLAPFEVLTRREKYILSELTEGRAAESIARRASVSISTVRSQIKAILQKLGVNSQLAATALVQQAGWTLGDDNTVADASDHASFIARDPSQTSS